MVKQVLQSIEGVAAYPIVSLILFLVAFLAILLAAWRMTPAEVERVSRLPLEDALAPLESNHGRV